MEWAVAGAAGTGLKAWGVLVEALVVLVEALVVLVGSCEAQLVPLWVVLSSFRVALYSNESGRNNRSYLRKGEVEG